MVPQKLPCGEPALNRKEACLRGAMLPVGRIGGTVGSDLGLHPIADGEQTLFSDDLIAPLFVMELEDPSQHDGIYRACLLAKSAINALEQIDIVPCGAPRSIRPRFGFDRDTYGGAHSLAKLAGDTPLLPVWVSAQRVQALEAWRLRRLLFRIVDGDLGSKQMSPRLPRGP